MVVQYKCPSCGADMRYDAATKKLKCGSCGRLMEIDDMPQPEPDTEEEDAGRDAPEVELFRGEDIADEAEFGRMEREDGSSVFDGQEGSQYVCNNCGAVVITTTDTTATNCSFCGAPVVLGDRLSGKKAPVWLIPFQVDKQQAISAFRKWCGNGKLTPKDFMTADRIKNITGMYVPFWLYDMDGTGEADCTATRVRSYSRGDYIYTETKYYHVYRRVHMTYAKVPVDASEKMNDELMDKLEPFSYSGLTRFNMPYLAGYLAEQYNYDDQDLLPRVKERVNRYANEYLASTIKGYSGVIYNRKEIRLNPVNARYTLLPVWMVCYDYHDSEHIFAMNGQTGKIVGKPPLSGRKIAMWFAGISAGVFALLRLVTMFFV